MKYINTAAIEEATKKGDKRSNYISAVFIKFYALFVSLI